MRLLVVPSSDAISTGAGYRSPRESGRSGPSVGDERVSCCLVAAPPGRPFRVGERRRVAGRGPVLFSRGGAAAGRAGGSGGGGGGRVGGRGKKGGWRAGG